jgi:hypothetical protein
MPQKLVRILSYRDPVKLVKTDALLKPYNLSVIYLREEESKIITLKKDLSLYFSFIQKR